MRSQHRDVDFEPLWNVVRLISNVATLILNILWNVATLVINAAKLENILSGTSRRCPALRSHTSHFSILTLCHPCLNLSSPAHPSTQTLARVPYHTGRRPVFCPPTPPSPLHTPSPLSRSRLRHTASWCSSFRRVRHRRSEIPH